MKRERYSIIYSSKTGNTKKLAEAIYNTLPQNKCDYYGTVDKIDDVLSNVIYIGFWTEKNGDSYDTYYDADLYDVEREFDLTIEGLTVESSKDKLDTGARDKTNNIINSIMPFDTENCVKWDANYIKGYTSEKRDTNVEELKGLVQEQSKDVARFAANKTLEFYDRGVRWDSENLEVKGQQWKSAYLPVWLYSYQQKKRK